MDIDARSRLVGVGDGVERPFIVVEDERTGVCVFEGSGKLRSKLSGDEGGKEVRDFWGVGCGCELDAPY